jgi:predicted HD phosphohydrolase
MSETVSFTRMDEGTPEDWALLHRIEKDFTAGTADRVLAHLAALKGSMGGYRIDRYQHSLQTATRALRDGASEEMVVAALLHDVGDLLAPDNHSDLAAAILQPYVSEGTHWVVKHHGIFQGYFFWHHIGGDRHAFEAYRGHPHFDACRSFCDRWDQTSFDPAYDTAGLDTFEPMVRRIFAREPFAAARAAA